MQSNNKRTAFRRRAVAAAVVSACSAIAHAQENKTTVLPSVEVVGTTPVPGLGLPKDQIPANVQTASDRDLRRAQSLNLPDFMAEQLPSVNVNETQGNPFQADVNYRGFTASPLLGTPQGLSVYLDGVRVNEPFGDSVNWDLIPRAAISSIALMPGSNPLFGLNTLGGALSLRTKSGFSDPGASIEAEFGSFRRRSLEAEIGNKTAGGFHWFIAGNTFREDGWRDFSPTDVDQLFAKIGQRTAQYEIDLSLTGARTDLVGNGVVPRTLYKQREEAVFTVPDRTENRMRMATLNGSWFIDDQQTISATLYGRTNRTRTLNGDVNDDFDPDEPDAEDLGLENRSKIRQNGHGGALQWSLATASNQLAVGATYDRGRINFSQTEAEGDLDNARRVVDVGDAVTTTDIRGRTRNWSVFVTDTYSILPTLQLTLSGRYNRARITTIDRMGPDPETGKTLDGDSKYSKFNPAVGLTWQASNALTVYGGFNQGNRAPSPIELGCADPETACRLPNAMASDPPLKQVVSRTVEAGVRGSLGKALRWNAGVYQTNNKDDILFIASGTGGLGYFDNVGKTQRRGVELGVSGSAGIVDWSASYSYVRARFKSNEVLLGQANSSQDENGNIFVPSGSTIPGIPAHSLKLNLGVRVTDKWRVGASMVAFSSQYARGNENNAHRADGEEFLHSGKIGGYSVFNLTTSYEFGNGLELFAKVNNVFDRKYASGAILAENIFQDVRSAAVSDERGETFIAPGAPRAGWIGVRYRFGG
ncbi:MAG: TonB-dependent receptor [Rhodocyclaceae bacterium]|nr:TonB-dependent receptor [Rhodocyclaceae bacterium]